MSVVLYVEPEIEVVLGVEPDVVDPRPGFLKHLVHIGLRRFVFLLREEDIQGLALPQEVLHQVWAVLISQNKDGVVLDPLGSISYFGFKRAELIACPG